MATSPNRPSEQAGPIPPSAVLGGLVVAGFFAAVAYFLAPRAAIYADFIVGGLAWINGSKIPDFAALLTFLAVACAAIPALMLLDRRLAGLDGGDAADAIRSLRIWSLIPAALWVGAVVMDRAVSLWPVGMSAAAVVVASLLGGLAWASARTPIGAVEMARLSNSLFALILMATMVPVCAAVAFDRLSATDLFGTPVRLKAALVVAFAGSTVGVVGVWAGSLSGRSDRVSSSRLAAAVRAWLVAVQVVLPVLYLGLVPSRLGPVGESQVPLQPGPALWGLVTGLVAVAWIDLFLRWRRPGPDPGNVLSPFCLAAVLVAFKFAPVPPRVSADDFHFGELLLPAWLWWSHGLVPFIDQIPVHGLVNAWPGFLSRLFFDGGAASFQAAQLLGSALLTIVALAVLSRVLGLATAFLCLLLLPSLHRWDGYLAMVLVLCILSDPRLLRDRPAWLAVWAVASAFLVLWFQQALTVVAATLPLAAVTLVGAIRNQPGRLAVVLAAGVVAGVVLWIGTPVPRMILGALAYVLENASGTVAFDTPWIPAWSSARGSGALMEAVRLAWVAVPVIAAAILAQAVAADAVRRRMPHLLGLVVPCAAIVVLITPHAFGRIDPDYWSRPGQLAALAVVCLIPLMIAPLIHSLRRSRLMLALAPVCGALALEPTGGRPLDLLVAFATPAALLSPMAQNLGGAERDNIGGLVASTPSTPDRTRRLQVLNDVLDRSLLPNETYLDLTNRIANYFHVGRPPPIPVAAPYLNFSTNRQREALRRLELAPPPVVLIENRNQGFDGGAASLRAPLLYRWVVQRYEPVEVGGLVFAVRPERMDAFRQANAATDAAPLALWDRAFRAPNLQSIPAVWGASVSFLSGRLRQVAELRADRPGEEARSVGPHVAADFDVSGLALGGRGADFLRLDVQCIMPRGMPSLSIEWGGDGQPPGDPMAVRFIAPDGRLLVPLSASPRWLLLDRIATIRIRATVETGCGDMRIRDVRLMVRTDRGD